MSIQFRLRDFCYPLALWRLRRGFERSQWFTRAELNAYQDELLRQTVTHAYEQVPYYQDLFRRLRLTPGDIRTTADLSKLPTLSKVTLREQFDQLRARGCRPGSARVYQSSGTMGEPVRFLLDGPANVLEFVYYWRHWSWAGYRLGTRFAELSSHYFLRDDRRAGQSHCFQPLLGRLLLNSLALSDETAPRFAAMIRSQRPRFLKGIASALSYFAYFLRQQGITDLAFQGVFSTGEVLLPHQRRLIEEVFHAKVYDSYGHMERTVAVSECPRGGLHINPEYGVLETLDPTPLPDEVAGPPRFAARVVGTSLHNRAMPLLRYEVGDRVEIEENAPPCPCGRSMPLIRRINGRQEDVIVTPEGRVVTTLFLVFNQVPGIALGQAVQEEPNRLVVRVVRGSEYTPESAAALLGCLRRFVGTAMKVSLEHTSAEELRRRTPGKFRAVVSRLPSPLSPVLGGEGSGERGRGSPLSPVLGGEGSQTAFTGTCLREILMALPSIRGFLGTVYRHPLYMSHLIASKFTSRRRYRWAEDHADRDDHVPPPLGFKLVLTYKCNLRCVMCYEWGEVGWCHEQPKAAMARELDWAVIEKLFAEVGDRHPYFILIGGEPLLYSRFGELARLLKRQQCFAITCTNGLLIDRFLDETADNPYLTYLISLDGPEQENDALRGHGVYEKVTTNLARLKALRRPPYIGVEFTIRPENVHTMYDFCKDMVARGVDWVLLNPCWFVSEEQARAYERFMQEHFQVTAKTHLGYLMPYELDTEEFVRQMDRINAEKWSIQISSYLHKPEHIHTYVKQPEVPPGNHFCYRQWARMDITPDGEVTPCILYPDLIVGDLHRQGVMEIWNSAAFREFRQVRRDEVLPICAKCNALYLHDSKRKYI